MREFITALTGLLLIAAIPFMLFVAWLTHVIHTIQSEEWLLLIAGAILFPIAIIHGIGLWLGIF